MNYAGIYKVRATERGYGRRARCRSAVLEKAGCHDLDRLYRPYRPYPPRYAPPAPAPTTKGLAGLVLAAVKARPVTLKAPIRLTP